MQKVMANFRTTFSAMAVCLVSGPLLVYGVRREWASGLGIALICIGAMGLLIDGVAERRAHPYLSALEAIAQDGTP